MQYKIQGHKDSNNNKKTTNKSLHEDALNGQFPE